MKRARPRNKKAAQKMMRQRELEYLRRQREEKDAEILRQQQESQAEETVETAAAEEYMEDTAPCVDALYEPEHYEDAESEAEAVEISDEAEEYQENAEDEDSYEEESQEPDEEPYEEYDEEEELSEEVAEDDESEEVAEEDETEDDAEEDEEPEAEEEDADDSVDDSIEENRTDIDLDLPRKSGKKKNIGKSIFKVLISAMFVFIVLVFVTLGFGGLFDDNQILAPLEDGKINVLLMGVDESGLRADAIMVATYDVNEGKINMMSIPRDTKIQVTNRRMTRKINEIHSLASAEESGYILGTQAIAETVTALTGIPINYYVEFSFASIDHLFDILGPVEFDVPDVEGDGDGMNYDDPYQNLHIHLKPGLQKLSGNQVQQFLRYRKSNSGKGTGSDTDRVLRQQEFVKAVVDQKINLSILLKLPNIFSQISSEIRTNISISDITKYIRYLNKLTGEGITTYSLPGEAKTLSGGSYFVANLEEVAVMMRDVFGFEAEVTDKVSLSETNPQKPLKVTYVSVTPEPTKAPTEKPTETPEPTKEPEATKEPTKAPTKEPTKEPTKAPQVTKEPTKAPTVTKEPEDVIIIL